VMHAAHGEVDVESNSAFLFLCHASCRSGPIYIYTYIYILCSSRKNRRCKYTGALACWRFVWRAAGCFVR
jgi:hypothetical protein